jgi:hypothetical protein
MYITKTIIAALLLASSAALAAAQSGADLLQQAQKKMLQDSDFEGAIEIYDRIVREFASDPTMTASAKIDRARAKQLQARVEARKEYDQILRNYADQPVVLEAAGRLLDEAGFPPGIYMAEFDPSASMVRGPVARVTKDWETVERFPLWSADGESLSINRITKNRPSLVLRSVKSGQDAVCAKECLPVGPSFWLPTGAGALSLRLPEEIVPNLPSIPPLTFSRPRNPATMATSNSLYRMDLQGSAQQVSKLPARISFFQSTISPDAKTIYVNAVTGTGGFVQGTIVAFDVATGERKQAFPLKADVNPPSVSGAPGPGRYVSISPDGNTIAVLRRPHMPDAHLALVGVNGDDYRELVTGAGPLRSVAWTSDGRSVLFTQLKPNSADTWLLMQKPANGGEAVFTGLEITGLTYLDVSKDGARIAFDATAYSLSPAGALNDASQPRKE